MPENNEEHETAAEFSRHDRDMRAVNGMARRDAIEILCSRHQFDRYGPGTEICRCGVVMGGRHATHLAIVLDRYLTETPA